MIHCRAYSNKNVQWDLFINGQTPSELTLVDIEINYPHNSDPITGPIYVPKFTFTFLGLPALYAEFGEIGNLTHSFIVLSEGNVWRGYLRRDVLSMPNTGYLENFQINGLSELEALKFIPYTPDESPLLVELLATINSVILDNTQIAQVIPPANYVNLYVSDKALIMNDDNDKISCLEVIQWISTAMGWRVVLDWNNSVHIYELSDLWSKGGADYNLLTHSGIDEDISTGEYFDSVIVEVKEARSEISELEFKIPHDRGSELDEVQVQSGSQITKYNFAYRPYEPMHTYSRYLGYFKRNQFKGWTFPKYLGTGVPVEEWWNPDVIFIGNNQPLPGAYPAVYKPDLDSNNWTEMMTVIPQINGAYVAEVPYMIFKSDYATAEGDFLHIAGQGSASFFSTAIPEEWPLYGVYLPEPYRFGEGTTGELWTQCPVPLIITTGGGISLAWTDYYSVERWFYASIRYGDKYWSRDANNWVDGMTFNDILFDTDADDKAGRHPLCRAFNIKTMVEGVDIGEVDIPDKNGYYLKLPPGVRELEIQFYIPHKGNPIPPPLLNLYNLTINKVNCNELPDFIIPKENPAYQGWRNEETINSVIQNYLIYLGSYKSDIYENFLSTLYFDATGDSPVEEVNYHLNYPQGGGYNITERPEYHIMRLALYYLSGMRQITDWLQITDYAMTYTYKGDKLWENGCIIQPLVDKIKVTYNYNRTVYEG